MRDEQNYCQHCENFHANAANGNGKNNGNWVVIQVLQLFHVSMKNKTPQKTGIIYNSLTVLIYASL